MIIPDRASVTRKKETGYAVQRASLPDSKGGRQSEAAGTTHYILNAWASKPCLKGASRETREWQTEEPLHSAGQHMHPTDWTDRTYLSIRRDERTANLAGSRRLHPCGQGEGRSYDKR